jgi:hypothetical protein
MELKELELYDMIALKEFDDINVIRTAERKRERSSILSKSSSQNFDGWAIASIMGLSLEVIGALRG